MSGLVMPDPGTDWTAPTTGPFPDIETMEDWELTAEKWKVLSWDPVITPVWNADGTNTGPPSASPMERRAGRWTSRRARPTVSGSWCA